MIVMQEVALSPKDKFITDISDLDKWDIIISGRMNHRICCRGFFGYTELTIRKSAKEPDAALCFRLSWGRQKTI